MRTSVCVVCGKPIVQPAQAPERKYCDNGGVCKQRAYRQNRKRKSWRGLTLAALCARTRRPAEVMAEILVSWEEMGIAERDGSGRWRLTAKGRPCGLALLSIEPDEEREAA